MLDALIRWSVHHPFVVLAMTGALVIAGAFATITAPVDVLPELAVPTLTVIAEGHGARAEVLESEVTAPVEGALADVPGVTRMVSTTGRGIALIRLEFASESELEVAQDVVRQRLLEVRDTLPPDAEAPVLAPPTSLLGEVMFVGVTLDDAEVGSNATAEVLRGAGESLRSQLRAVPGVAEVSLIGGREPTWDVVLDPAALAARKISPNQVLATVLEARAASLDAVKALRIGATDVSVGQVASVKRGTAAAQGVGSIDGKPAAVLGIQKAPGVNSLALTADLDDALDAAETALPAGQTLHRRLFRQADFIERAVNNVTHALRDGSILVVLIVLLFLASGRATLISALAIPLSLLAAVLALRLVGVGIDTMTLGGMTIAVGAIVDDAIIDVENVVRRLRLREAKPESQRSTVASVVSDASREIRGSIVFATVVIALVFAPLFFLGGFEGRLLRPLGLAYVAALGASLVVALTITPALCVLLLPRSRAVRSARQPKLTRALETGFGWILARVVRWWAPLSLAALLAAAGAGVLVLKSDRGFLPPFNEASLTVEVVAPAGSTLEVSDALGRKLEEITLAQQGVITTARRTGRAAGDEHAQPVHNAEVDVTLNQWVDPHAVIDALRTAYDRELPELETHIGAPIAHRVDHTLADVPANVAVKIYGPDLGVLTTSAQKVREIAAAHPNVADAWVAKLRPEPQSVVSTDREALARLGLGQKALNETIEIATEGHRAGAVDGRTLMLRFPKGADPVLVGTEGVAPLSSLTRTEVVQAPSAIRRQNGQRVATVVVAANTRDLVGTVEQLRETLANNFQVPEGYDLRFEGQFEVAQRAQRTLLIVSALVFVAVLALLIGAFRSATDAAIVLLNLPLALVGGAVALPLSGGLSIATLIGFIALFGIATRNGIMLVSHIRHVVRAEGETDPVAAVLRATRERLSPILMTAAASALGLLPLAASAWDPGGEIQGPMARVILLGLASATVLNMFVIPAVYLRFGTAFRSRESRRPAKS